MGTFNKGVGGSELEGLLGTHADDRWSQASKVFIPVNLGNLHWVALCLNFEGDQVKEVYYFDPAAARPHIDVLKAITRTLGDVNVYESDTSFQTDGYNCGPWIVEWFKGLVDGHTLPSFKDMTCVRVGHLSVPGFKELLERNDRAERLKKRRSGVMLPLVQNKATKQEPLGTYPAMRAGSASDSQTTSAVASITYQNTKNAKRVLQKALLNGGKLIKNQKDEHAEPEV